MCVLTRVRETAVLFLMVCFLPAEFAARGADRERCIEKDQNIGIGNSLPHGLDIGMFLRDVAASIAMSFEPRDQGGFARTTGSNYTNQRSITWRLHICRSGWQPDNLVSQAASPTCS